MSLTALDNSDELPASSPGTVTCSEMPRISLADLRVRIHENQTILDHWVKLQGNNAVALRQDFDPLEFADALTHCIIVQALREQKFKVQLFGTELVNRFGRDLTGLDLGEIYQGDDLKNTYDRLNTIQSLPAVLRLVSQMQTAADVWVRLEFLGLPFANADGQIDHILLSAFMMPIEMENGVDAQFVSEMPQRRSMEGQLALLGEGDPS